MIYGKKKTYKKVCFRCGDSIRSVSFPKMSKARNLRIIPLSARARIKHYMGEKLNG